MFKFVTTAGKWLVMDYRNHLIESYKAEALKAYSRLPQNIREDTILNANSLMNNPQADIHLRLDYKAFIGPVINLVLANEVTLDTEDTLDKIVEKLNKP